MSSPDLASNQSLKCRKISSIRRRHSSTGTSAHQRGAGRLRVSRPTRPQIGWNNAQSPEPSLTRSCQPLDLIRSGFWRVRRKQKSRPRQCCFAPHSRAARRSEVARRAGQSRLILCTGWARIVDDAEDMVDSRAVVEKQRPIRGEAIEQLVECGLSGYLGTCHQYAFETSRLPFGARFRSRRRLFHLAAPQVVAVSFCIASYFPAPLVARVFWRGVRCTWPSVNEEGLWPKHTAIRAPQSRFPQPAP
jgi:hypothetical protein